MATMAEIIDRATNMAAGSLNGPVQDSGQLAETLLPEALHEIASEWAGKASTRHVFRETKTVVITTNVGTLPTDVLTDYLCDADILDANGDSASLCSYSTILGSPDTRLAWMAVKEGLTIRYLPVGGAAYTANIFVTTPCVPELPAASTSTLTMPEEAVDSVIRKLADKIVLAVKNVSSK